MNFFAVTEILFLVVLPLLIPRVAAAPVLAAAPEPAAIHRALVAPRGGVALAGLPPAKDRPAPPTRTDPADLGPAIGAESAIVVDRLTGAELYAKDADRVHAVASLTKLMTALVVTDASPVWDAEVTIAADDLRGGGVEHFIPGERVTVADLFYASLVGSSNTATAALARSTGLSTEDFVGRMNAKADALGMRTGRFADPTGLDEGNRGSARDAALLAGAAFRVPEIAQAATTPSYSFVPRATKGTARRTVKSTDLLLGSGIEKGGYGIAGAKTGTLGVSTGFHVAVAVRSPEGREVITVVLGSDTNEGRFADAKALSLWAFRAYTWTK